jgi:TetR/AcrR family transcriptional regulator, tetracycline repressor protein
MARPKIPLISRRSALVAALKVIDDEGLEALSIRRLADELGVNGASLYHHFANKDEILTGAARLALAEVRTPDTRSEPWPVWIKRNANRLRDALLEHPGLIPIVASRGPLELGTSMVESTAALLEAEGLRLGAVVPLLEALELFAVSSAMHESRLADPSVASEFDYHEFPTLRRAAEQRELNGDELFDLVAERIIDGIVMLDPGSGSVPVKTRGARSPKPATPPERSKSAKGSAALA